MPDLATRGAPKQRWAEPGSTHDRLVRASKLLLPVGAGILILILAIAPLDKHGDVSFILDKKKVQTAPERMRVDAARYTGTDNKGEQFIITAANAVQRSSDTPLVDIFGMNARLNMEKGPLLIKANKGRYNLDSQRVAIDGPIRVVGADGFQLTTKDVVVDLKQRQLASGGPAQGQMRLGQFQAGHISADLGSRTVALTGGARLKIVQGAVR